MAPYLSEDSLLGASLIQTLAKYFVTQLLRKTKMGGMEKKFIECIIFNFNICRYVLDMSVVQNVDAVFTCLVTLAILIQACS